MSTQPHNKGLTLTWPAIGSRASRRMIVVVGKKIYRAPSIVIKTTPPHPLDKIIGEIASGNKPQLEYAHFVNGDPVDGINTRISYRKSGRPVFSMDS